MGYFKPNYRTMGTHRRYSIDTLRVYSNTKEFKTHENKEELLKRLLDAPDINVNAQDNEGQTALMMAIIKKHYFIIVQILRHYRIDVNVQDDKGRTALMIAAYFADDKII